MKIEKPIGMGVGWNEEYLQRKREEDFLDYIETEKLAASMKAMANLLGVDVERFLFEEEENEVEGGRE